MVARTKSGEWYTKDGKYVEDADGAIHHGLVQLGEGVVDAGRVQQHRLHGVVGVDAGDAVVVGGGDELGGELDARFRSAVRMAGHFLADRDEHGVLANHHAMAVLPIYEAYDLVAGRLAAGFARLRQLRRDTVNGPWDDLAAGAEARLADALEAFAALRCAEFVRTDICYQKRNVKELAAWRIRLKNNLMQLLPKI